MTPDEVSRDLEKRIPAALAAWQNRTARSQEVKLGMSSLGGCRELIRATVTHEVEHMGAPPEGLKWAAFVGTALGDLVETALTEQVGAQTQHWVRLTLPSGIVVSGSTDAIIDGSCLIDLKTKAYLDDVRKDGPSLQHWIQVSGYLVGLVQAGTMTSDSTASLVYLDRSGNDQRPVAFTIDYETAVGYVEAADERLTEVGFAIEHDERGGALRDYEPSYCFYIGCPMRKQCWPEEYEPGEQIVNPAAIAAMEQYDAGRALAKAAKAMQQEGKSVLGGFTEEPIVGNTDDFILRWKQGSYGGNTIDLRRVKK